MENGKEPATAKPDDKTSIDKFVDDMLSDAIELRAVLHAEGNKNDIKERITCLKYLEDIVKTYFIIKKASTHDPDAAGSTVRKYATAFAKNATGGRTKGRRGVKPAADGSADVIPVGFDDGDDSDTAA